MPLTPKWKALGDTMISWWNSTATSIGLVSWGWAKGHRGEPTYPCNPAAQLPRARLRAYTAEHEPSASICAGSNADFNYRYSVWLQLLQVPGQDHQELLLTALEAFMSPVLQQNFQPSALLIDGVRTVKLEPFQSVVYDELDHPLGDPALRVSSGELNFALIGEIKATS